MKTIVFRRVCQLTLLLTIVLTCAYYVATGVYGVDLRPRAVLYQLLDPPGHEHVGISKQLIISELGRIHNQLTQKLMKNEPPTTEILHELVKLIQRIEPQYGLEAIENNGTVVSVCSEKYLGPQYGIHNYFIGGWMMDNCTNAQPLEMIITLVFYFKSCSKSFHQCSCKNVIQKVLDGCKKYYPKVSIHVAIVNDACRAVVETFNQVAYILNVQSNASDGEVWTKLIDHVNTPYVLIGRDVYHFWNFSRLERQIRIIDSVSGVKVVGGAFRNATRHWHVGCYQSELENYMLKYDKGYYVSRNECMFCDHLMGPFVALKDIFKAYPLDISLSNSTVFYDFFMQLKRNEIYTMNCPDVMYYASPSVDPKHSWLPFVKKWSLNDLHLPASISYSFTCPEADLSCANLKMWTRFYLMPPCCALEFKKAVAFIRDFCVNNSLHYEYTAGSVLGAVKMSDFIPWDLDGDILYYTVNHSAFRSAKEYFAQNGFSLTDIEDPVCCYDNGNYKKTGYIQYNTPQMYIEMFGELTVADEVISPPDFRGAHTLIEIHGEWVNGPPNPGLYARNRYGVEILKHAQSWIHVGKKSSWELYEAGHFKPCPKHNFHACLDRFPTDGSLVFHTV